MPAAHLPTPANLPNLNAKSAGAPPVRWRRERDGGGTVGGSDGERKGEREGRAEDTSGRKTDIEAKSERASEKGRSESAVPWRGSAREKRREEARGYTDRQRYDSCARGVAEGGTRTETVVGNSNGRNGAV